MRTRRLLVVLLACLFTSGAIHDARALPFDSTAVELVAFTDYQCPFCSRAESTLDELRRIYGANLRIMVRHQPLAFHANARAAAEAAEAARDQGQFELMHDRLFANQHALSPTDLVNHAAAIGLDVERFKRDIASPAIKDRVERDREIANAVGATGTPTFFINGRTLRGAQPLDEFKRLIDEEIAEARRLNRLGEAWLSERLNANNASLWGYLRGGQPPPKDSAPTVKTIDDDVYQVTVDPAVDAYDGPADALVTMVVFLDYQCPFCAKLEPTLGELMTRYAGKLRRVVKHNPLPFHKDAREAAKAAICAQAQGRFWQMHDSLYGDQRSLDAASFKNRASVLGLDLGKFERCLDAPATEARIKADVDLAGAVTARGTPNTFINGRKLTGAKPIDELAAVIDQELARSQARVAGGVKPHDLYQAIIKDGKRFTVLDGKVHTFKHTPATPILGNAKAKVRITVFSDIQCPFCARLIEPLRQLVKLYPGKVAVAWKNFPLTFHKDARLAAIAAQCAHAQKKFWPALEALYERQKELAATIPGLPELAGLDVAKYGSCVNGGEPGAHIDADIAEGQAAEVKGTPTIFIQGRRYTSPSGYSVESFKPVIDALLAGREP